MGQVSITGNDTVILDGLNIIDLADGDNSTLTHPNEIMNVKVGKNGNVLYAANATGQMGELVLRIVRGSFSDRALNKKLKRQEFDPASFVLMNGTFIKRIGNGIGFVTNDTYVLVGGVFFKKVDSSSNAEGNTDQSIAVYSLRFGSVMRAIQ